MKKSTLKEAIKGEISSILSENEMTTAEAFRALRDIHSNLPKWGGPEGKHYTELMGQALDVLQRGEISRMMSDEERESKLQQAMRGGGKEKPLRKLAAIGKKEDQSKSSSLIGRMGDRSLKEEAGFPTQADIDDIESSGNIDIAYDKAMKLLKSLMNKSVSFSDVREDEEPTSAEVKKEKSIAAEKEAALKAQKALKDLKDKMKKKAKEFKEAEGDAKEKIKAELKKMTAEKKELEKSI